MEQLKVKLYNLELKTIDPKQELFQTGDFNSAIPFIFDEDMINEELLIKMLEVDPKQKTKSFMVICQIISDLVIELEKIETNLDMNGLHKNHVLYKIKNHLKNGDKIDIPNIYELVGYSIYKVLYDFCIDGDVFMFMSRIYNKFFVIHDPYRQRNFNTQREIKVIKKVIQNNIIFV